MFLSLLVQVGDKGWRMACKGLAGRQLLVPPHCSSTYRVQLAA